MKAVVFGGGNIGRGFLGQLLFESGFETVFVDINQMLLDELNARNRYPIKIVCNEYQKEITVENVRGVHSSQAAAEIADADIRCKSPAAYRSGHPARPGPAQKRY